MRRLRECEACGVATVLLIGGGSSVGKTTAATALAETMALPLVSVDALRRDIGPSPFRDDATWDLPPARLLEVLRENTRIVGPAIVRAVGTLSDGGGGVIEGEGIEPDLVASLSTSLDVKAVYIIETEHSLIRAALEARPSSATFRMLAAQRQTHVIGMNLLYSHWLREQAESHCQPWIPARPWSTLVGRLAESTGFGCREGDGCRGTAP